MIRLSLRGAVALAAVATLVACGTDPVTAPGLAPSLSRAAADAPYVADVDALTLRPGMARTVVVTGTADGRPVPAPSIRWSTTDAAVATVDEAGVVTAVGVGTATVAASRGAHAVAVAVTVVDPCAPLPLALGTTAGEITADDCFYAPAGRFSDYFSLAPANGEVVLLATSGLDGITGVKEATLDPALGTIFGSRANGATYRVIGNGDPLQFYVSGRTGETFGAYAVTRGTSAEAFQCGALTFVVPGASFANTLTEATSCRYTIRFSPYPEAIGQPIATQSYWMRLQGGREHTVTLGGVHAGFAAGLTIFPNVLDGAPVAQSVGGLAPGQTTRTVTFTPATDGYYMIEVSSGRIVDGTWAIQTGDYTVSVSR